MSAMSRLSVAIELYHAGELSEAEETELIATLASMGYTVDDFRVMPYEDNLDELFIRADRAENQATLVLKCCFWGSGIVLFLYAVWRLSGGGA